MTHSAIATGTRPDTERANETWLTVPAVVDPKKSMDGPVWAVPPSSCRCERRALRYLGASPAVATGRPSPGDVVPNGVASSVRSRYGLAVDETAVWSAAPGAATVKVGLGMKLELTVTVTPARVNVDPATDAACATRGRPMKTRSSKPTLTTSARGRAIAEVVYTPLPPALDPDSPTQREGYTLVAGLAQKSCQATARAPPSDVRTGPRPGPTPRDIPRPR